MPKSTNPTPAYRWPNTRELRAILSLLEEHVEPIDNETCRYKPGWSDAAIARAVGQQLPRAAGEPPVSHASVGTRRKELYGDLISGLSRSTAGKAMLRERMQALEERVKLLEDLLVAKN